MSKRGVSHQPYEDIPKPWKKRCSNKGNWYYYNPETNVSVWDLKTYLMKQDPAYFSEQECEEESEFSVSKHDGEEIVLDSKCASVYDEIFNGFDDDYDDYPTATVDSIDTKPKSAIGLTCPYLKPVDATSARRFASKRTAPTSVDVVKKRDAISSKRIVSLRSEPSVLSLIPEAASSSSEPLIQKNVDPLDSVDLVELLKVKFNNISEENPIVTNNEFGSLSLKAIHGIRLVKHSKSNSLLDYLSIANPLQSIYQQTANQRIIFPDELMDSYRYLHNLLF